MILVDTSAIYALADAGDAAHARARESFERIEETSQELVLHTYVLVETFALLHRRLGLDAALQSSDRLRAIRTVVVDREIHDEAAEWLRDRRPRGVSLVDAVSFVVMRREGIRTAFAFDPAFVRAGFRLFGGGGEVREEFAGGEVGAAASRAARATQRRGSLRTSSRRRRRRPPASTPP